MKLRLQPILVLTGIAGLLAAQAQTEAPATHAGRLVKLDVMVRAKTGVVTGLNREDFTLLDKGKPQKIEVFSAAPGRDAGAKFEPPAPVVGMNRTTRRGEPVKSAIVILYDRVNTPASDQPYTRKLVLDTLSSLKDTEIFAFYSLGRNLSVVHDFTEDPGPLIRAAARLGSATPQAAPADPADQTAQKALEDSLVPQQDLDTVFRVDKTARAFQSITRHLSGLPGRKGIAWITRTFPLTFGADFNRRNQLELEVTNATVMLQEENIALYPINPGGVGRGFSDRTTPNDTPTEGRLMPGSNASISNDGAISENSTLSSIAQETGGIAYYNMNEIASKVREVLQETELVYTLGFYPENKTLDGHPHDFGVKVAKASGATVRFRKRYLATKEDPMRQAPGIPELAADPLEATGIQLAAVAERDPARAGVQKVSVSVNVADLQMTHAGDHWTGAFELALALDGSMGATGGVQLFNLNWTEEQMQKGRSGLIVSSTIDTKNQPGRLRAVVRDKNSGAAGSVQVPLAAQ